MKEVIVEFLVEEPSMKNVLDILLPKLLPEGYVLEQNCFIRPHQGKSDLQKSIPKKVRAYKNYPQPVKLIVIQDQDSNDCIKLKSKLLSLIINDNATLPRLVRIACKELENWYLGDMSAIEKVYPNFRAIKQRSKAKYRNPDNVFGSYELEQQVKGFAKGYASKTIPKYMDITSNVSPSFRQLVSGIEYFLKD